MSGAAIPLREARHGRYELLERIGQGGMAEVFLARERTPLGVHRLVALKRMSPLVAEPEELAARFVVEAQILTRLSHPNIVAVHDTGIVDGRPYLVMEYVAGLDLRRVLSLAAARRMVLPVECALYLAAELARGLAHAHELRDASGRSLELVHRDVSPANVLVSDTGHAKLVDFGVARVASGAHDRRTADGTLLGKVRYMSPEQARGQALDRRSDLFSLGTVLLELLSGEPAFAGDSELASLRLVQAGIAPERERHAARLGADLGAIVDRAMAPEASARFGDAGEMAEALEGALRRRDAGYGPARLAAFLSTLDDAEAAAARRARVQRYAEGAPVAVVGVDAGLVAAADAGAAAHAETVASRRVETRRVRRAAGVMPVAVTAMATGPRRGRGWIVAAAALLALGGAGVAWRAWRPPAASATSLTGSRTSLTESTVATAVVKPLAAAAGAGSAAGEMVTPLAGEMVKPVAGGMVKPLARREEGRPAAGEMVKPVAPAPRARSATLSLQSVPWAAVTVDGARLDRTTPILELRVAPGPHRLVFSNPGYAPVERRVRVGAGETQRVLVRFDVAAP